ncbi:TreE [Staphylococcus phage LSA2302]|nr:TreE [Staphylococcus phage LSA2302]
MIKIFIGKRDYEYTLSVLLKFIKKSPQENLLIVQMIWLV